MLPLCSKPTDGFPFTTEEMPRVCYDLCPFILFLVYSPYILPIAHSVRTVLLAFPGSYKAYSHLCQPLPLLEFCLPDIYLPSCLQVSLFKPPPPFSMRSILTTLFNGANCTKPSGNTTAFILFYIFPYCVYDFHLSFLECRHLETRGLSILCIDLSQEIRTASGRLAHSKQ